MNTQTFAGIPGSFAHRERAKIWLQSIPYDGTSTWGKGADRGFEAFMEAAANMELFDIETGHEVYLEGIHLLDELGPFVNPQDMYEQTYSSTQGLLKSNKFLTFFGGEHSISIGIMRAFYERFSDLTILQIDAHADLRPTYEGSPYNHACALHLANMHCNVLQVGIRSMDKSEKEFMHPEKVFYAAEIVGREHWMENCINKMTEKVYITFDLDAFDPALMPATGTPEPGGLQWYPVLSFLRKVFEAKEVVGFDIVELAPIEGNAAPQFLAAKLYYKMLSYKFSNHA